MKSNKEIKGKRMNILQRFIIWLWYDRDNKTYSEAKNDLVLKNTLEKAESKKNPDKEYIKHLKVLIKFLENDKVKQKHGISTTYT